MENAAEILGHRFREDRWLSEALTHRSYVFDHPAHGLKDNERLEFLGDAVVGLVVSRWLFERFPDRPEGELTRWRAQLVKQPTLATLARTVGLGPLLRLGRGPDLEGARDQDRMLASAFEAVVGAIFIDGGWEAAHRAIIPHLEQLFVHVQALPVANPKGTLQEMLARRGLDPPAYRLVASAGPPHRRQFTVELSLPGGAAFLAQGSSLRRAEEDAARLAIRSLEACAKDATGVVPQQGD